MPAVTLPLIDGSGIFGPSGLATDQTLSLPLIDGGAPFGVASAQAQDSIVSGMVVTKYGTVMGGFGREFTDELVGAGGFKMALYNDDADMPEYDDVLTFSIDGVQRFVGRVEGKHVTTVDPREEVEHVTVLSGRNHIVEADQALIEPIRGLDAIPVELSRLWAWPSLDYNSSAFPASKRIRRSDVRTARFPHRYSPEWWPDKTSWWVWADRADVSELEAPLGRCLFRHAGTLAADARLAIFLGMDNFGTVYFNGARITETENDASSYTIGRRFEVDVSAGDYLLAANVKNLGRGGGFNFTIWTVDDEGLLDTMIAHSDYNTVKCLGYPTGPVGFTAGEVIRLAVEEAQARGEMLWNLDFTDTLDSAGNPWEVVGEISIEIGRTVWELFDSLQEWLCDIYRPPGAALQAYNWGTRGTTRAVTLATTTDPYTSELARLVHDGKHTRANRLVLTFRGGHTEVIDAASVTANGQRTAYVSLGDGVDSESSAQAIGTKLLDLRKDPSYAVSFDLTAAASIPYDTFDNGDTITHPDETGTPMQSRVRSITVKEDDDTGVLDYGGTVRDVRRETSERLDLWLRRMGHGALDGGARVVSRLGEALKPAVRISTTNVAEFSYDNVQLTASHSPKRPADSSGNLIELYATLTTAGTSSTTVRVFMDGAQVGTDLVFAAGAVVAEVDLEAAKCFRNINVFQVQIVSAGAGAKGLDVQVRAI